MRLLIVACGFVLLMAVGLQVVSALSRDSEQPHRGLADGFPDRATQWEMTDQPIAETPEMAKAVGELLNFDDAFFRIYRKGTQRFDVYAAYWRSGKMSERAVAGHTPDVCWVAAGWTKTSQDSPRPDVVAFAGFPSQGQYRVFKDPRGVSQTVVFWHKAGTRFVAYESEGGVPRWWTVFTDLATYGRRSQGRQYFVRISANVPWEELARDPDFRAVTKAVGELLK